MVLLESSTAPQGLQDHVLNTIKPILAQLSSPELSNTALCANKISAKPSDDLILLEGLK
jgi:hypothetical protein